MMLALSSSYLIANVSSDHGVRLLTTRCIPLFAREARVRRSTKVLYARDRRASLVNYNDCIQDTISLRALSRVRV